MYNLSLFFSFSSRMFEPTFSLFRHFVYVDLSRNLVPRSSHSLRLSRHFEYISILVGNFGHVILLCARVFSRAAAILKSEKTLGTRLAYGLPLEKAKSSLTWSHGRHKYNNLVFTSFFSRVLRSVSEVLDDCCTEAKVLLEC